MKTRNLIEDGFTKPGRVSPEDGLHEGCEFTYRPLLREHFLAVEAKREDANPEEDAALMSSVLAKQVQSWSEVGQNGQSVPLTTANCRRIPLVLGRRLYGIVCCYEASDLPLQTTAEEQSDYLDSLSQPSTDPVEESAGNSDAASASS